MHKAFCERFKPDSVVQFDAAAPYRPVNLSEHGLQAVLRRGNRPRDRNPVQVRADDTRGPGRSPPRSQHRRMTPKQAGPICCIVETDGFPSIRRAPDILRCIGHVMNEALALKLLRNIMNWDEETAASEYRWVRLMSRFKYDGYRDYVAGARFVESFAGWLIQFDPAHRAAAYEFIKTRLIYFSPLEIHRLVDQFYAHGHVASVGAALRRPHNSLSKAVLTSLE
jgi:hypothetical protein